MSHRSRFTLTALTLVAAAAFAPQAQASGFQLREQSPLSLGNAFAGISAGGGDISSLYFNPAVMTQYDGIQFSSGGTYIGLSAKFESATAARTPVLTGLGFMVAPITGTALSPISGPAGHGNAAISAILPEFNIMYSVSSDLKIGLSLNVPYGLATEYDTNWIGRYHALKTDLKTIDISPSIAYRLSKDFSFGLALIARRADAELSNSVDYGTALALKVAPGLAAAGISTVPVGAGQNSPVANITMGAPVVVGGNQLPGNAIPGAWDGVAGLKGGCWAYGYKLGLTYEPSKNFRMGLAYNAAMSMTLTGDSEFSYPSTLPAFDLAALQGAGLKNTGGSAELNLPSTTSLGFDWKVSPTFSLQGEVARTNWSTFKELRVHFASGAPDSVTDESWNDSTFTSLGATWKTSDLLTLRAGLAFDTSAVDDNHRTPRIPDNDRKWLSVGASYKLSEKATVDIGYSRLFIADGKTQLTAAADNVTRGTLTGVIKANIHLLGASLRYSF
jgi:long-chain fatty acid transport protein